MRQNVAVLTRTLLLALIALPTLAEETPLIPLGVSGVVKADLALQLYQDGDEIADPGIVLTEKANGRDYIFTGLPDVEAGDGTVYCLVFEFQGIGYSYPWPTETRTPQAVVNRLTTHIARNPLELAAGATIPSASLAIHGLSSDPSGAAATMTLTQDGEAILDAVAATVTGEQASDGTWSATVTHDWTIAETAALEGSYSARFTVVFPGGAVLIEPRAPNIYQVVVYP